MLRASWVLGLVAVVACAKRPPPVAPIAPPVVAVPPPAGPESPWKVRVRVVAWTQDGEEEIGELPGLTPAQLPATPWFVEPLEPLDRAELAQLVATVRSEQVPGLSLRGQQLAGRLGVVADLPALKALLLDDTDVDGPALAALGGGLVLDRLGLARTLVDDAAMTALGARHGATLLALDLEDCPVGDAGLRALAASTKLRALVLAGTRITDAGGAALRAFTDLDVIDLGGTPIGEQTVAALRGLHPRQVFVDHTKLGRHVAGLAPLAPALVRFDASALVDYKATDAEVAWLAKAPALVEVGLSGSAITDATALEIAQLALLRTAKLANTKITKATITALSVLPELRHVDLADTPVDDATASAFLALPNLRTLRIDGTWTTDAALQVTPSPVLVELWLSRTAVTDAGMAILDQLPRLEALGVGKNKIGDPTLARIVKLKSLRILVLSQTDASVGALVPIGTSLPALERLYLDDTQADLAVVAALAPLHDLVALHLTGTGVTDDIVPTLRRLTNLTELALGDTRIRGAITDLDAWPQLRVLSLYGHDIDDARLAAFARRTSLATLDLSVTDVTNPAPLLALPNLRTLGLVGTAIKAPGETAIKQLQARGVEVIR